MTTPQRQRRLVTTDLWTFGAVAAAIFGAMSTTGLPNAVFGGAATIGYAAWFSVARRR